MSAALIDQTVVVFFIGLLAWAAVSDYRDYIIPNSVSLSLAVLYFAHVAASPVPVEWLGALAVAAAVLAVGLVLFAFSIAGGGDIKLLAATVLWAGPDLAMPFLVIMALAGGVLALATASHLRFLRPMPSGAVAPDDETALKLRRSVPYAIAIATAGAWVAGRLLTA